MRAAVSNRPAMITVPTIMERKQSMTIDKKSPDPRWKQIRNQFSQMTRGLNTGYRNLISTDEFKDMIQIQRQFGSLHLGHDSER
jgi:hypothetical protein